MIEKGIDLNNINKKRKTPLDMALDFGREKIAQSLMEHNCKMDYKDRKGNNLLHMAAQRMSLDTCKILLQKFDWTEKGEDNLNVWQMALVYKNYPLIDYLIDQNIDLDLQENEIKPALVEKMKSTLFNAMKLNRK